MTFNKISRTIIPPIFGYLAFIACDGLFEKCFPNEPPDDLSTPGIVFLLEYVMLFFGAIIVFTFQYKVVVPNTFDSTKKAITLTVIFGLIISLFFAFMHYIVDNGIFNEVMITFFGVFIQFESFILGNLTLIALFNSLTEKSENNQVASR
ncbi:MAG: hypothetical protein EOO53_20510 [Gammaproteobacteria bacterium]|nr:MAG: hypothetical protein EOO53_20510 [Gammaproteobacteria bacterium]